MRGSFQPRWRTAGGGRAGHDYLYTEPSALGDGAGKERFAEFHYVRYGVPYRAYVRLEAVEDGRVLSHTVQSLDICVRCETEEEEEVVPASALSFSAGPMAEEVKARSFVISYVANVGSSRRFSNHVVLLPSGAARPTAEQIRSGQDGQGNAAIAARDYYSVPFEYAYVNLVNGEYVRDDASGTLVNGCHTFVGEIITPNTTYEAYVLYDTPEDSPIIGHTRVTTRGEGSVSDLMLSEITEGEKKDWEQYAEVNYHYSVSVTPEGWADASRDHRILSRVAILPMSEVTSEEYPSSHRYGLRFNHPRPYHYPLGVGIQTSNALDRYANVVGIRYGEWYRVYVLVEAVENQQVLARATRYIDVCERCEETGQEQQQDEEVVPSAILSEITEGEKRYLEGYAEVECHYTVGVNPEGWDDVSRKRLLISRAAVLPMSEAIELDEATSEFFASHRYGVSINHPLTYMYPIRARVFAEAGARYEKVVGLRYGEEYRLYVSLEVMENGQLLGRVVRSTDIRVVRRATQPPAPPSVPADLHLRIALKGLDGVGSSSPQARVLFSVVDGDGEEVSVAEGRIYFAVAKGEGVIGSYEEFKKYRGTPRGHYGLHGVSELARSIALEGGSGAFELYAVLTYGDRTSRLYKLSFNTSGGVSSAEVKVLDNAVYERSGGVRGLARGQSDRRVSVVPNPVLDVASVSSTAGRIEKLVVRNVSGKEVMAYTSGTLMDASALKPGLYLLEVLFADGERAVTRFIKK